MEEFDKKHGVLAHVFCQTPSSTINGNGWYKNVTYSGLFIQQQ